MDPVWMKRGIAAVAGLAIAGLVVWMAWPRPVPVDLATAVRGSMEVTVSDEANTRVRHIYTVSAPIAGKVLRISPPRHVGDEVTADDTVLAMMQPVVPGFHDARTHEELQAALTAADAAVRLAESEVRRIDAALAFSRTELQRVSTLARTEAVALKALDKAKFDVEAYEAGLASAKAQFDVRRSERASVGARLNEPTGTPAPANASCCIQIRAPASGRIIRIVQESEAVVQAGASLLEVGDPHDVELVADLISSDAVRVQQGALMHIEGWGGPPLAGRVTRVDPAGFMKVSALGIEEQRVRTVIGFADPPESGRALDTSSAHLFG